MKFKPGDKIKCVTPFRGFKLSEVYTVLSSAIDSYYINSDNDDNKHGTRLNRFEKYFEIVTEEKATPPKKSAGWGF